MYRIMVVREEDAAGEESEGCVWRVGTGAWRQAWSARTKAKVTIQKGNASTQRSFVGVTDAAYVREFL